MRTNFMIIDEGFSACDEEKIEKVKDIIDGVKEEYKWVVIISHIEGIKRGCEKIIRIEREGNNSKIGVLEENQLI